MSDPERKGCSYSEKPNESDTISRQDAIQTALDFMVEYLGGAFDEDFQRKLTERMNALPSAQPEWNELMVICDNCGHAIHVKRQQGGNNG